MGISAKAIRVYHDRGLLPEAQRDCSGYRRYGAAQLVGLARITRLRAVGLSLREIAPLIDADDGGVRLRDALGDLDAALAAQVRECEQRRALLALVLDEGIDDPVAVSAADVCEERSIALLRPRRASRSSRDVAPARRASSSVIASGAFGATDVTSTRPIAVRMSVPARSRGRSQRRKARSIAPASIASSSLRRNSIAGDYPRPATWRAARAAGGTPRA